MRDKDKKKEQLINELSVLRKRNAELEKAETERRQAEKALRESEEKFRNLADQSPSMIFIYKKGRIVYANRKCEEMMGYKREEFYAPSFDFRTLITPGSRETIEEAYAKHMRGEEVEPYEYTIVTKDGRSIEVINSPKLIVFGGEKSILGIVTDITKRKRDEEEIKKTKDYLDNIIESSLDCIVISDSKGYVKRVNKSFLKLLGYKKEEIIGKQIAELGPIDEGIYESTVGELVEVGKEYFNYAKAMTCRLFEGGKIHNWEGYFIRNDKIIIPAEENLSLLYNGNKEVIGAVGIIRDITERKKVEEALQREKEFSNTIIETADVLITGVDIEGNVVIFNRKAEEVTGYSRAEVMGKDFIKTFISEKGRTAFTRLTKEIKEGNMVNPLDASIITKGGEERIISSRGTTLKNREGEIIGILGIGIDVTESRKMEKQLLQSEKLKSLGELAGGVAHDFNNVLAAILGRAQLLKMNIERPTGKQERRKLVIELKKSLEIIESAAKDGAETVRRIQEFSRRRDEDKYFTTIDVNEIIDNALEFTKVRWKDDAESKGIKIKIQKEFSTLPPTSGSAAELREVFTNLINNAVDAVPQGGSIRIKTFKEDSHIVIKVKDTGVGITNDRKDRIFDPFFTTKGVKSSGLGLSVSYGIINRHRGTITVDSVEGKGTTFTIRLPISEEVIKEEQVNLKPEKQRKAKILVIEDEENVRDILSAILIEGGHEVETAIDGSHGIKMFEKKEFDLVFTDLGMPGMSGWQVAEKVKKINKNVPVAFITGWNVELNESEMRKSGVDLIVYKPFELNKVLKLVLEGMMLRDRFKAA